MANTLKLGAGKWATGNGTVLAFNDENNNFKPLPFTFTRASKATVVNQSGLIEEVSAGDPRIDFKDNSSGALLLEPLRSNKLPWSNKFTNWSPTNISLTENSTISPDGSLNATKITDNATFGNHRVITSTTTSSSGNATYSIFLKKGTMTTCFINFFSNGTIGNTQVDLENGTISGGTGVSQSIEPYGNGWYRVSITGVLATTTSFVYMYMKQIGGYNGVGDHMFMYGATLEESSYASSYIPTSGSAVTRVSDACNNGGNEQVINSTEGVLYGEVKYLSNDIGSGVYSPISISGGSTNFVTFRHQGGASNRLSIFIYVNNVEKFVLVTYTYDLNNYVKIAVLYSSSGSKVFINGTVAYTDTINSSFPSNTLTEVEGFQGGDYFKGNIKDLRVYNTALTDAELIALTTI